MAAAVAALVAAVVAGFVGVLVGRTLAARRVAALARRLELPEGATTGAGLQAALQRIERAVTAAVATAADQATVMEQLQAAVDALPLGFVVVDQHERVLVRNQPAEQFLGVRYADALVAEAVRSQLRRALAGEASAQTLELHGPPRHTILVRGLPVEGPGAGAAIALVEDVSERARVEAMRTDFVANISHELRTPVGALVLLAETLEDEDEPEVMHRLAQKMVAESSRVARIVDDLLQLSRLEADVQPEREEVLVSQVMVEAVERVRDLAQRRDVEIDVAPVAEPLTVVGDRRQLVSALANLVENGVKYSDPGSRVDVVARRDDDWVELSVADRGIGIPVHDQDRIFERFYRVDRARSRDTGGTGLGLAIVRHVATNHGGTVTLTSAEGVGSTFTIRVPGSPASSAMREAG